MKDASRYRKRYAPAQTACARLLAWPDLKAPQRRELRARQAELDPLALVEDKERRRREILALARRSSRPTGSLRAAPRVRPRTSINSNRSHARQAPIYLPASDVIFP